MSAIRKSTICALAVAMSMALGGAALAHDSMPAMLGAGGDADPAAAVRAGALVISSISVPETPGGNGAVYLTIRNAGTADRLTAARSDLSAAVELHTMSMDGAVMEMRKVDGLDVPANGALIFGPGGNHIMLIGLKAPLRAGVAGTVILVFDHQGEVAVPLIVSARSEGGGHDRH